MYATLTTRGGEIVKAEVLEVLGYSTTRFNALRNRGAFMLVTVRGVGTIYVWADEITIHP